VEDGLPDPNHPPVPTAGFAKYVGKLHKSDDRGFMIQYNVRMLFQLLPDQGNRKISNFEIFLPPKQCQINVYTSISQRSHCFSRGSYASFHTPVLKYRKVNIFCRY
jgi:hypothetical protein